MPHFLKSIYLADSKVSNRDCEYRDFENIYQTVVAVKLGGGGLRRHFQRERVPMSYRVGNISNRTFAH